jgi:hypothetical protein
MTTSKASIRDGLSDVYGITEVNDVITCTDEWIFASGMTNSAKRKVNVTTVNAATYSTLTTDFILHVTYTATGTVAITLPTAQVEDGRILVVKDAGGNAGTNNITISTQGSETIDGSATATINSDYSAINLYSNGTNWYIY